MDCKQGYEPVFNLLLTGYETAMKWIINVEIDYNYCDVSGLSKDLLSTCWDDSMVITVAV